MTLRGSPHFVGIGVDSNGQPFEITEKDFTRCVTVSNNWYGAEYKGSYTSDHFILKLLNQPSSS